MSDHYLLAISIGPVQEFIASARRTRDLWFGSHLLSEISKAAALAILDSAPESLVFPAPARRSDLEPESQLNVANVILAHLDGVDPKRLAEKAREAARMCWRDFAKHAREQVESEKVIDLQLWADQVDDVIEFYAAWVNVNGSYKDARTGVMRLLAGRKACRNFDAAKGRAGIPKSSLDGLRESVWSNEARKEGFEQLNRKLQHRLRLTTGEELDTVGLTKRLGQHKGYPSVSRIAADPWLRGVAKSATASHKLNALKSACEKLIPHGLGRVDWPQFSQFPYEGTAVYRERHKELGSEIGNTTEQLAVLSKDLGKALKTLQDVFGPPEPYLALLVADGDEMGKAISSIESAANHRRFSGILSQFASKAEAIITDYQGALIYSGGDDVLALLPVDQCLNCASELHVKFGTLMSSAFHYPHKLTLSVGIAIGHFMEPLEDLRHYALDAEKAAKQPDRNGLAIHLHPRGGAPIKTRSRWDTKPSSRLSKWIDMCLGGSIPDKAAYDLRELARDYDGWSHNDETEKAIASDVGRMLKRKRAGGAPVELQHFELELKQALADAGDVMTIIGHHTGLMKLATEWLIAQRIARACRQANPQEPSSALTKEDLK